MKKSKIFIEQYLKKIDNYNSENMYQDNWESLYQYQVPNWYKDAKIGIFFHWGLYTIPKMGSEWYSRNMYQQGSNTYKYHLENYGEPKDFGYKDFIPLFTAKKFKAEEWTDLGTKLGAKYFVPVAEHHDGFQMYKSEISEFNSFDMGPKVDFISELEKSTASSDMNFAVSSHRAEHFWFMEGGLEFDSGIDNPQFGDLYWPTKPEQYLTNNDQLCELFLQDWLVRCCELVDNYRPRVMYFDWWIEMPEFKPYVRKFLAYFYNKNIEFYGDSGVVNYKHDGIPYLVAVRDIERGQFDTVQTDYWQCCTSVARNSWSYTENNQYKEPVELIHTLIDVISKNGNLLLNSGPGPEGDIVEQEVEIFTKVGEWVKDNSKAIYNSRSWKKYGEGDTNTKGGNFSEGAPLKYKKYDMRFTMNKNKIFVFMMNPIDVTTFEIKSMAISKATLTHHAVIKGVKPISSGIEIESWNRNRNCLEININEHDHQLPIVFEVEIE